MGLKTCLLLLVYLFSIAPLAKARQTDNQQLSRAQEIWEDAILAKGGRQKLESVRNIFISSRSKYWHGLKRYEVLVQELTVFPGKIWLWQDYRPDVFGLTVELYDFDKGIKYFTNSDIPPPQPNVMAPYETSLSHTYGLLGYLMETKWLKPKVTGFKETTLRGRKVDVVHTFLNDSVEGLAPEDFYIDFWLDRETHLPLRVSYTRMQLGQKSSPTNIIFSKYVDVNGIKIPSENDASGKVVVQLSVDYNEKLFSKPPSIASGPDAWKATVLR